MGTNYTPSTPKNSRIGHDIAAWQAMFELVQQMDSAGLSLDPEGFHMLCVGLEKALRAAKDVLVQPEKKHSSKHDALLPHSRHRPHSGSCSA